MNRIDRLFAILTCLQSKKYVPAEQLSEKFQISVRTVYRDVKALCEAGIPISFEQYKGYFVVQGYFLPPISFTSDEANALLLIETIVGAFADKSIKLHYSSVMNKVQAVLKTSQKENIAGLSNNIKLQVPECFRYDFDYLSLIQQSIVSKKILEIEYKNNLQETNKRLVEPIGLIFYALNWHLIAWCHLRNEYHDFKVPRIIRLRLEETPFKKSDHIELNDYLSRLPVTY